MIVAVTFGTAHNHVVQDIRGQEIVIGHSTIALIECNNVAEARRKIMNSPIGQHFCTTYDMSILQSFQGMSRCSLVQIKI